MNLQKFAMQSEERRRRAILYHKNGERTSRKLRSAQVVKRRS